MFHLELSSFAHSLTKRKTCQIFCGLKIHDFFIAFVYVDSIVQLLGAKLLNKILSVCPSVCNAKGET